MNPQETYAKYVASDAVLRNEYRKYWLEKFGAAGITLVNSGTATLIGNYQGYDLRSYVWPAQYEGIKFSIGRLGSNGNWHEVKVKSESGFVKLVRRLQRQEFK